jgi:hypothetical protein
MAGSAIEMYSLHFDILYSQIVSTISYSFLPPKRVKIQPISPVLTSAGPILHKIFKTF